MKNRILLVGPLIPPVHGQALAFTRFVESIDEDKKIVVNTNLEDKSKVGKIFGTFKTLFTIAFKALFSKYDVVYFTCSRSFLGSIKDIVLINLVSLRKVKIVNHLHGSDFYEFLHNLPSWYQKILIYSYKKVAISIVLLDSMKEQFSDFKDMKVEVVSNFYDKELDEKFVEKDTNKINLVYLSNIMSSKGIFELIEAFEELSRKYDNIYLNIAGGYISDEYMSIDEVKEKFEKAISQNDRIKYLGKTFGEDKVRLLQSSDIFVLPSYYKSEAFPISIIEAMACENAIVTTNYKYLPEIVDRNNGIVLDNISSENLVDAFNYYEQLDYKLFVNGSKVSKGIAKGYDSFAYYTAFMKMIYDLKVNK
jgi:glycosyltransferase involved in cell wall biosynthesis